MWVVEMNIAGCKFQRWARKRRHLLDLTAGWSPTQDRRLRPRSAA